VQIIYMSDDMDEALFVNVGAKIKKEDRRLTPRSIERGKVIGEEVNQSRHIATMPGGAMTPDILARHARATVKGLPVKVTVLNEQQMEKLGMGGRLERDF
jgi:leucyl aminopeptidase